ncbi:MAG: hypothetical protein IPP13_28215 [Kouleothrix sp.]|jgi:hypothetical protein|nr:hypothetical protein [Kouleothrix sp.]
MTPLLLIIGLAALAALRFRPTPHTHVVYVPIEVAEARGGGLGCAPMILLVVALLIIALLSGT